MSSLNQVNIIGRCGRDPELKYLPSGDAVTDISVATTETWKDKSSGEKREETEWHRVVFFGKLAEVVSQYVKKGSLIFASGSIKSRKYTDREGAEKTVYEIKAQTMKMLGGRPDGDSGQQRAAAPAAQKPAQKPAGGGGPGDMDDDIPFAPHERKLLC